MVTGRHCNSDRFRSLHSELGVFCSYHRQQDTLVSAEKVNSTLPYGILFFTSAQTSIR